MEPANTRQLEPVHRVVVTKILYQIRRGSHICIYEYVDIFSCVDTRGRDWLCPGLKGMHIYLSIHFFLFEHTHFLVNYH